MNGKSFKIEEFVGVFHHELRLIIMTIPAKLTILLEQVMLIKYGFQTRKAKVSC